jgi:hypothetical protein
MAGGWLSGCLLWRSAVTTGPSWHGCIPCFQARHGYGCTINAETRAPNLFISSPASHHFKLFIPSHPSLSIGSYRLDYFTLSAIHCFVNSSIVLYPASIIFGCTAVHTPRCTLLAFLLRFSLLRRLWPRRSKRASLRTQPLRKDARRLCEATSRSAYKTSLPQEPSVRQLKRYAHSHLYYLLDKNNVSLQAADGLLLCTLEEGILRDQYSRTGSIVSNRQFQFDGPPQAGAMYTGGFSVCQNKSLAIGGSSRWWRCMSGEFGNLYDMSIGEQCTEIRILVDFVDKPSPSSSSTILATSTSATDLTLATSGTRTASAVSGVTSHTSHSMTSDASTGMASSTTSPTASPTASRSTSSSSTVTKSSSPSSATSSISLPDAPLANGGATLVKGATMWSVMAIFGVVWAI